MSKWVKSESTPMKALMSPSPKDDDPDQTILYYGNRGVFENEGEVIFINKLSGPDQKSFRLPMGKYWQIKNEYTDHYQGPMPEADRWIRVDENYFR